MEKRQENEFLEELQSALKENVLYNLPQQLSESIDQLPDLKEIGGEYE